MKKEFLIKTALSNTQSASLQRGSPVYVANASDQEKQGFKDAFKNSLRALETRYKQTVPEKDHIRTIQQFVKELSRGDFRDVLVNGRLTIGRAQKAVNLYLKFLWCLDLIKEPPHCPVDSVVLETIGMNNIPWTRLDSVNDYMSIIDTIKRHCRGQSPAKWECDVWNNHANA
ncbi:MAG TPA: hypothetical protein VLM89_03345 [Phycisphaerae bacterium]|nr:hypothetical protein [Phycisphaerae bacterium]